MFCRFKLSVCRCRTTGVPKGVELSHYNLVANSTQLVHKRNIVGSSATARARKARLERAGERWLAPLPMYHAYVMDFTETLLDGTSVTDLQIGTNILLHERRTNRGKSIHHAKIQR